MLIQHISYITTLQFACIILLYQMENGVQNLLFLLCFMLGIICIYFGYFLATLAQANWHIAPANNKTILVAADNKEVAKAKPKHKLEVKAKI